jgi:hypothetical protein
VSECRDLVAHRRGLLEFQIAREHLLKRQQEPGCPRRVRGRNVAPPQQQPDPERP